MRAENQTVQDSSCSTNHTIRKSYKRECQETFFSDRLRRRMLSCIQPPAPSNAHAQRLIVLDLAEQQRGIGFRFPAVSCL
jgi:hypothetical protein